MSETSDHGRCNRIALVGRKWVEYKVTAWLAHHLPDEIPDTVIQELLRHVIECELPHEDFVLQLRTAMRWNRREEVVLDPPPLAYFCQVGERIQHGKHELVESLLAEFLQGYREILLCCAFSISHKVTRDFQNLCHRADEPSEPAQSKGLIGDQPEAMTRAMLQWMARPEKTPSPQRVDAIHLLCEESELAFFTRALREHGQRESTTPEYQMARLSIEPARWGVTLGFGRLEAHAEGPSECIAKHRASQKMWHLINGEDQIRDG